MNFIRKIKKWFDEPEENEAIEYIEEIKQEECEQLKPYYEDVEFGDIFYDMDMSKYIEHEETEPIEIKKVMYGSELYNIPIYTNSFYYKGLKVIVGDKLYHVRNMDKEQIMLVTDKGEVLIDLKIETQLVLFYLLKNKFKL